MLSVLEEGPGGLAALRRVPDAQWLSALAVDAVTLSLRAADSLELVWWVDPGVGAVELEDAQYLVGEGPTPEAAARGCPMVVPDLEEESPGRWPILLAHRAGMGSTLRAVAAVPVCVGRALVGVFAAYRRSPGPFLPGVLRTMGAAADAVGRQVARGPLEIPELHRDILHQAAGAVSVREGITTAEAAEFVRARLFTAGRDLIGSAEEILGHADREE
ncbi:hypothetical protein BIV57_03905 [Mangrovactinospora gilvigrisea]|uniref:GAF domain-containing protein n=1 Tax=Mangrovactinospora gilvigrisea TaxID=1428644 RepID=A0A1J7CGH3_9ACTN|nr:GAF domain-containing protein [Mangrovactinospora gilvigrisea]OIV38762.1 hypothetical protein BIV57_03905 [Mangrovactinospora gilvigrisea]